MNIPYDHIRLLLILKHRFGCEILNSSALASFVKNLNIDPYIMTRRDSMTAYWLFLKLRVCITEGITINEYLDSRLKEWLTGVDHT